MKWWSFGRCLFKQIQTCDCMDRLNGFKCAVEAVIWHFTLFQKGLCIWRGGVNLRTEVLLKWESDWFVKWGTLKLKRRWWLQTHAPKNRKKVTFPSYVPFKGPHSLSSCFSPRVCHDVSERSSFQKLHDDPEFIPHQVAVWAADLIKHKETIRTK